MPKPNSKAKDRNGASATEPGAARHREPGLGGRSDYTYHDLVAIAQKAVQDFLYPPKIRLWREVLDTVLLDSPLITTDNSRGIIHTLVGFLDDQECFELLEWIERAPSGAPPGMLAQTKGSDAGPCGKALREKPGRRAKKLRTGAA